MVNGAVSHTNPHNEIAIFARLPVPGQVKTRLAAGLGNDAASTFYEACLQHVCGQGSA